MPAEVTFNYVEDFEDQDEYVEATEEYEEVSEGQEPYSITIENDKVVFQKTEGRQSRGDELPNHEILNQQPLQAKAIQTFVSDNNK